MKKVLLFLLVMQISLLWGNQFEILSEIKEEQMNMSLALMEDEFKLDNRGELGALVIINCGLKDVLIQNKAMKIYQVDKTGVIWVVMKQRCKNFTLSKENFPNYRYDFPFSLQSGSVYSMTIGDKQAALKNVTDNLKTLTFELNTEAVMISYDNNAPLRSPSNFAQYKLPEGTYNFKFSKSGYETTNQTIDTSQNNQKITINLKAGSNNEKFSPPALVIIESEPEGATVILNGQQVGVTPYQGSHYAGEYTIAVQKELCYSQNSTFTLKANETVRLPSYKLIPKYGIITISSNPKGATVKLDGSTLGKTPINEMKIDSGAHTLTLELPTYQTTTKEFSIKDGDKLILAEEIVPNFSAVTLNCLSTEGAQLTLNGEIVGNLPYHNPQLLAGKYRLEISKDLWISIKEELLVPPNESINKDFVLTPNFATINITAPQADIFINAKKEGSNYLKVVKAPGTYHIRASRSKHLDANADIVLLAGQEENINLEPQARLGSVSIMTVDKYSNNRAVNNANIYLDNKLSDQKTPALISLIYGDYDLKISHPQFLDFQQKFTVTENEHREITLPLETYKGSRQHQHDKHKKRAWIATGLTTLLAGGAVTCNVVSNSYFDEYESSIDPKEALDYKDKTQEWRDIRDYTYYTASGVALYTLYSWIITGIYNE